MKSKDKNIDFIVNELNLYKNRVCVFDSNIWIDFIDCFIKKQKTRSAKNEFIDYLFKFFDNIYINQAIISEVSNKLTTNDSQKSDHQNKLFIELIKSKKCTESTEFYNEIFSNINIWKSFQLGYTDNSISTIAFKNKINKHNNDILIITSDKLLNQFLINLKIKSLFINSDLIYFNNKYLYLNS